MAWLSSMGSEERELTELLRFLSNPVNVKLIVLLSSNTLSPSELSRMLGKYEADISRRLNKLRELGLIESKWTRVGGKNIKLYRLTKSSLHIDFSSGGIIVTDEKRSRSLYLFPLKEVLWRIPSIDFFVGRKKELKLLNKLAPGESLIITGLAGIGKTTLVSYFLKKKRTRKYFWHTITESDTLEGYLKKLSLYLVSQGKDNLQKYIASEWFDSRVAWDIALAEIEKTESILVFDDLHKLVDNRLLEMINFFIDNMKKTRIIIISRKTPRIPVSKHKTRIIELEGLDARSAKKLLEHMIESRASLKTIIEAITSLKGHPLLLKLFGNIILEKGEKAALQAIYKRRIIDVFWKEIREELSIKEKEIIAKTTCMGGSIPREIISEIIAGPAQQKALNSLLERGLLKEDESGYRVNDILMPVLDKSVDAKYCWSIIDDYLTTRDLWADPEKYLKALQLAVKHGYEEKIIWLITQRVRNIRSGILDYPVLYLNILEEALKKPFNQLTKTVILSEKGVVLLSLEREKEAIKCFHSSLPVLESYGYNEFSALIYSRLIRLDMENALKYAEKALELSEEIENTRLRELIKSHIYSNLARHYALKNEWEKARKYVMHEIQHARTGGDPVELAFSLFHKTIIEGAITGHLDAEELKNIRETLAVYGPKNYILHVVYFEALAHIIEKRYDKARKLLTQYIREGLKYKFLPLPCSHYGLLYIVSLLEGKKPPYKNLKSKCITSESTDCPILVASLLTEMPNEASCLEQAKKHCTWVDFVYLDKIFGKHNKFMKKYGLIKKKIGYG